MPALFTFLPKQRRPPREEKTLRDRTTRPTLVPSRWESLHLEELAQIPETKYYEENRTPPKFVHARYTGRLRSRDGRIRVHLVKPRLSPILPRR